MKLADKYPETSSELYAREIPFTPDYSLLEPQAKATIKGRVYEGTFLNDESGQYTHMVFYPAGNKPSPSAKGRLYYVGFIEISDDNQIEILPLEKQNVIPLEIAPGVSLHGDGKKLLGPLKYSEVNKLLLGLYDNNADCLDSVRHSLARYTDHTQRTLESCPITRDTVGNPAARRMSFSVKSQH